MIVELFPIDSKELEGLYCNLSWESVDEKVYYSTPNS